MGDPSVTAVVVNYRSRDHLERCLRSLLDSGGPLAGIIVVDNSPGDGSADPARQIAVEEERVEVMDAPRNLGLAGGVNAVLGKINTPYLAAMNPDVTVAPGWLAPLVAELDSDPTVGVACPVITMAGTGRINSAGLVVHVTGLGFNRMLGVPLDRSPRAVHDVGGLHGAAFVIRTELLHRLGGWNDLGFLYHEDVALSWDVLLDGWRIVCVPGSVVDHDYHLTMYPEKLHLLERNRWALLLSHLRWRRLAYLVPALVAVELVVWGLCLLRGVRFASAKLRSYGWLWRNKQEIASWRERVFARARHEADRLRFHTTGLMPLKQVLTLGRERKPSTRVPEGGLKT